MASIDQARAVARKVYEDVGVDVDAALNRLSTISLSLHCWQGDDVTGFERRGGSLDDGGLKATGNFPGKARTPGELRQDFEMAFSLLPGKHRVNLHAIYGEFGSDHVERDAIALDHFGGWIDWARHHGLGIDFNPTLFAHPRASSGFTLSSKDPATRAFWIAHVQRCREIAAGIGKALGTPCANNVWIPDGMKDVPVDRLGHRRLLVESLDEIFGKMHDPAFALDFVEGKLFGIGSESFVTGSHEFYLAYAMSRGVGFTMDMGHYHPTESVADKIPALLPFIPPGRLLVHVSRGVRWDSDHVVILNDDLAAIAREIVRAGVENQVHLALDYFDASINRVGAWVTGARATLRALLDALLEPVDVLRELEEAGKGFQRLALLEDLKNLPAGVIWDQYCESQGVPAGRAWVQRVEAHERDVLSLRK